MLDPDIRADIAAVQEKLERLPEHERRQALEYEVDRHTRLIFQIKREINKLSSISVLPPEILEKIFMAHAEMAWQRVAWQWEMWGGGCDVPRQNFSLGISQVCSHWRATALNCPALWNNLDLPSSEEWTKELVARAKALPLIIRLDLDLWPDAPSSIPPILPRISYLGVRTHFDLDVHRYCYDPEIWSGPAPLLDQLVLINGSGRRDLAECHISARNFASSVLSLCSGASSPRLTRLRLCQWPPDLARIASLSTLTHLKIEFPYLSLSRQWSDGSVDFDEFLRTIKRLPLLESLKTEYSFPFRCDSFKRDTLSDDMVTLPRLRSLTMKDGAPACVALLSHLTLPVLSALKINVEWADFLEETEEEMMYIYLAHEVTDKVRGMGEVHKLMLFSSCHIHASYVTGPSQQPSGVLNLSIWDPPPKYNDWMHIEFLGAISARTVRSLIVSEYCGLEKDTWGAIFRHMPNVTDLQMSSPQPIVFEALKDPNIAVCPSSTGPSERENERPSGYPFPSLRVLTLGKADFSINSPRPSDGQHGDPRWFSDLVAECLLARQEKDMQLQELRLRSHLNLRGEDIDRLQRAAPVVEWDPNPAVA
ncbi:hypothetical protein WOLCODRAFT_168028 [Wolfiporia cocos MD-104 SS10]|uniref:Uncharacterized protein n=1 Tax=Wolfiporia cocos (strain MD-104) TaxID=742152 RepID=A0A2H3JPD4_WOLCO|nr:hypothetical protein WOLCODRAFT_168028 [Wolfiporia cocos MD-104 SS10]